MKWTQVVSCLLFVFCCCLLLVFFAPALYPHLLHASMPRWLLHIETMVFPGGNVLAGTSSTSDVLTQPFTWLVFGSLVALYIVASVQVKALTHRGTFGSSAYARGRQVRDFHVSRLSTTGWHLLLLVTHVAAIPVRGVLHRAGVLSTAAGTSSRSPSPSLFHVGRYRWRRIVLREQFQEEHVLITGPTGSRKSTLLMLPNELREHGHRSLFIADLKQEQYHCTAGALSRTHQIWWFNPSQPDHSHGYNPLAFVHDAVDANMLADCWVVNTGESKDDPYWSDCARLLLCAVILHLRATEPDAPFERVADTITGKAFADLKSLLMQSPSREARRKAAQFLHHASLNERLVGSLMTEIGHRFELFDSEAVRLSTARNEIDFHEMVDVPTAFYLTIPRSEVDFYRPLMACLTMQMFRAFEQRVAREGTLPRGITCYLDEFANLGTIPHFDRFISTSRYLRIALIMVVQNFAQLDANYGAHNAETIRENANTHILLPGAGLRECRYYSERIGDQTVQTQTRSSRGSSWGATQDSWTQGEARRRLLTPEELRTMPERTMLFLRSALPPLLVKGRPYYEDRRLARLAKLPYPVTPMHQQSPAPTVQTPPPHTSSPQPSPLIVDADQGLSPDEVADAQQHFLDDL